MSMNTIIVSGRLTADPEKRTTNNGDPMVNLRVAQNFYKNREEQSQFFAVTVFGRTAESCAQYLTKGREVVISGELQTREYQDKNGNTRTSLDIAARQVDFLSGGKQQNSQNQGHQNNRKEWGNSAPQQNRQQWNEGNSGPIPF